MNTLLIAQARFQSTRLPGKVLYPIAGRTMLDHVVERVKRCRRVDRCVVATSTERADDIVADWCDTLAIECFRGSENDVLTRFLDAARHCHGDVIVRVCADAPMLDPAMIDDAIDFFFARADRVDYISNMMRRTFPRGESVEVMRTGVLEKLDRLARAGNEREHVTPYLIAHRDEFRTEDYLREPDLGHMNWTVDTPADLAFVRRVFDRLYQPGRVFGIIEVEQLLNADAELARAGMLPH